MLINLLKMEELRGKHCMIKKCLCNKFQNYHVHTCAKWCHNSCLKVFIVAHKTTINSYRAFDKLRMFLSLGKYRSQGRLARVENITLISCIQTMT